MVGGLIGMVGSELLFRLRSGVSAILAMSLVMAYASFIVAEHLLHVSGVMASASAAVALGVFGVARLRDEATDAIGETWELVALVCNSLLFWMIGMSVNFTGLIGHIDYIAVAIVLVLVSRAATVYSLVPITTHIWIAKGEHGRAFHHVVGWIKGWLGRCDRPVRTRIVGRAAIAPRDDARGSTFHAVSECPNHPAADESPCLG